MTYVPAWTTPRDETGATDLHIGMNRIRLYLDESADIAPGPWGAKLAAEGASEEARKVSAVKAAHETLKRHLAVFEEQAAAMGITL